MASSHASLSPSYPNPIAFTAVCVFLNLSSPPFPFVPPRSAGIAVGFYGNGETCDGVNRLTYSLRHANRTITGVQKLVGLKAHKCNNMFNNSQPHFCLPHMTLSAPPTTFPVFPPPGARWRVIAEPDGGREPAGVESPVRRHGRLPGHHAEDADSAGGPGPPGGRHPLLGRRQRLPGRAGHQNRTVRLVQVRPWQPARTSHRIMYRKTPAASQRHRFEAQTLSVLVRNFYRFRVRGGDGRKKKFSWVNLKKGSEARR